jgi:hypothetical protein
MCSEAIKMVREKKPNPLSCRGIIGDGCGGGRDFFIKDETLFAYDETSNESITLLEGIKDAKKISKSGCIITIECIEAKTKFDLSLMSVIN